LYYDQTSRERVATLNETRDTFDLDFQHQFTIGDQHTVVWGAGYRVSSDKTEAGLIAGFNPNERTLNLYSAFFQDEIEILKNRLSLTLGVKGEHNDFTEFEVQPNARAERTFGYSREDAIGKPVAELIIPADLRPAHNAGLAKFKETRQGAVIGKLLEMRAIHADGTEFPVELFIRPISVHGPQLFTGFARDITVRKRAEARQICQPGPLAIPINHLIRS
jgi:PAS domain S-box-containing protein